MTAILDDVDKYSATFCLQTREKITTDQWFAGFTFWLQVAVCELVST
jgi:hypothetical protein